MVIRAFAADPTAKREVFDVTMLASSYDTHGNHPTSAARLARITIGLILEEGGFVHPEALRAVVPLWKARKGYSALNLVWPVALRRPHKKALTEAPLETRFLQA